MIIAVDDYQGFLAAVSEVESTRGPVTVTRNGKPVAQLAPVFRDYDSVFGFYAGKGEIVGDIDSPLFTDEENEEFEQVSLAQLT